MAESTALMRESGDREPTSRHLDEEILAETEQHTSQLADDLTRQADARP